MHTKFELSIGGDYNASTHYFDGFFTILSHSHNLIVTIGRNLF